MPLSDRTKSQIIDMIKKEMEQELSEQQRRAQALKGNQQVQALGFYLKLPYVKNPYLKLPYVKI